jgi:rhodanese-related sulfurtransferase
MFPHNIFRPSGLAKTIFCTYFLVFLGACEQKSETDTDMTQDTDPTELQFVEKAVGKVVSSDVAYSLRQQGKDIVFVSVRERGEWDEYHIPGAVWIPHSRLREGDEFSWKLLKSLSDTHDYVLTYCGAGHRSGFLAAQAREREMTNIFNLDGISFWKESYPVVHGPPRSPDKMPKAIHLDEAHFYFEGGYGDVDFIDVREPESIAMSGGDIIKGSQVIPLSDIFKHLDQIDCGKDIVLMCEGTFDGGECSASPAAGKIIIDRLGCKAGHIKYMIEGFGAWQAAGHPVEAYAP